MLDFLLKKEEKYLRERGFEIRERAPTPEDSFPYIVLNGKLENEPTIEYRYSHVSHGTSKGQVNPVEHNEKKLINLIICMAKEGFKLEDGRIDTKPGEKIPLYVPEGGEYWRPIAQKVVKKYSNSSS